MHFRILVLLSAALVPAVLGSQSTVCYNYFLKKDGCVFSSPDKPERCPAPAKPCSGGAPKFALQAGGLKKRDPVPTIGRRYNSNGRSFPVLGGRGICKKYDTNAEEGVCLWTGTSYSGAYPATAGWLNGAQRCNCGKRVYIQRRGDPDFTVYAPVIDGCTFNTLEPAQGCFEIALTNRTFNAFNPTDEERSQGAITGLLWDFDNLAGKSPSEGPC